MHEQNKTGEAQQFGFGFPVGYDVAIHEQIVYDVSRLLFRAYGKPRAPTWIILSSESHLKCMFICIRTCQVSHSSCHWHISSSGRINRSTAWDTSFWGFSKFRASLCGMLWIPLLSFRGLRFDTIFSDVLQSCSQIPLLRAALEQLLLRMMLVYACTNMLRLNCSLWLYVAFGWFMFCARMRLTIKSRYEDSRTIKS